MPSVDQPLLEGAGLEAGAHQDGDFGELMPRRAAAPRCARRPCGPPPRSPTAPTTSTCSPSASAPPGVQRLAQPPLVMRDQCRGRGQDRRGGAVIRLQPDDLGAGEILLESQDVLHLGAAPGIDRSGRRRRRSRCSCAPAPAAAARDTAPGWCPGTRPPGCSGTCGDSAPAPPAWSSAGCSVMCSSRSPKSAAFSARSRSW